MKVVHIRPGVRFNLTVRLADGTTVTGSAVPDKPALIASTDEVRSWFIEHLNDGHNVFALVSALSTGEVLK